MSKPSLPIELKAGVETLDSHPLIEEIAQLAERHDLQGAVLISFSDDGIGANSCGYTPLFAMAMGKLADDLLCAIDDGQFDRQDDV